MLEYSIDEKKIKFEVFCGKGTYIRSLCEDIATKFETVGYMKSLQRIQVGDFNIEDSITIEQLEKNIENNEFVEKKVITIQELFKNKDSIKLNDRKLELFLNGVRITQELKDGIYKIYNKNNDFIGIGIVGNQLLKRDIVL